MDPDPIFLFCSSAPFREIMSKPPLFPVTALKYEPPAKWGIPFTSKCIVSYSEHRNLNSRIFIDFVEWVISVYQAFYHNTAGVLFVSLLTFTLLINAFLLFTFSVPVYIDFFLHVQSYTSYFVFADTAKSIIVFVFCPITVKWSILKIILGWLLKLETRHLMQRQILTLFSAELESNSSCSVEPIGHWDSLHYPVLSCICLLWTTSLFGDFNELFTQ